MLSQYQEYIHMSRYSRWREDLGRREFWPETVKRLMDFYVQKFPQYEDLFRNHIGPAIERLEIMPSMRSLMTAGPALDLENIAAYNCYYHALNDIKKFSETLYILMCGTGVGFSCEKHEVDKLPSVPELAYVSDTIVVQDSKLGWAQAYHEFITGLYSGHIKQVDVSLVRPAGAPLRTFGGRASGPAPLLRLFKFTEEVFFRAQGRKLKPLEVHDIMCTIGEVVVVGGVRRSALISLSDLGDHDMRNAKAGNWWDYAPWRSLANNSAVFHERPDAETFLEEWHSLVKSKSGERGIFNRKASQAQAESVGRSPEYSYGCNPCSEIILRDGQFCNLTEVCARPEDTVTTLRNKVRLASILGTFQSTLTNFNFLRDEVRKNTEEERLLGVSITGILDCSTLSNGLDYDLPELLELLRADAALANAELARELGIPESAAITCVKPSGTVSQLCDTASGLHPRHSKWYLRTTRLDKKDPLYQFLKDSGMYIEDDQFRPNDTAVVYFPMEAPQDAATRESLTAIEHLELWLMYQRHWCDHKPSVTISVKDSEWPEVGAWVFKNFDEISGISFLPYSEHTYVQAPYQELTEKEYRAWVAMHPTPKLDWSMLQKYETIDMTTGTQEYACVGGQCEL